MTAGSSPSLSPAGHTQSNAALNVNQMTEQEAGDDGLPSLAIMGIVFGAVCLLLLISVALLLHSERFRGSAQRKLDRLSWGRSEQRLGHDGLSYTKREFHDEFGDNMDWQDAPISPASPKRARSGGSETAFANPAPNVKVNNGITAPLTGMGTKLGGAASRMAHPDDDLEAELDVFYARSASLNKLDFTQPLDKTKPLEKYTSTANTRKLDDSAVLMMSKHTSGPDRQSTFSAHPSLHPTGSSATLGASSPLGPAGKLSFGSRMNSGVALSPVTTSVKSSPSKRVHTPVRRNPREEPSRTQPLSFRQRVEPERKGTSPGSKRRVAERRRVSPASGGRSSPNLGSPTIFPISPSDFMRNTHTPMSTSPKSAASPKAGLPKRRAHSHHPDNESLGRHSTSNTNSSFVKDSAPAIPTPGRDLIESKQNTQNTDNEPIVKGIVGL